MLSIDTAVTACTPSEYENVAFAPDELATLSSLMERYDQVMLDLDSLNGRLQELLDIESPSSLESGLALQSQLNGKDCSSNDKTALAKLG